jgi:hypothetical protein
LQRVGRISFLFFFFVTGFRSYGQLAGKHSFEFLNIPVSSRMSGLGGMNVSLADKDVNFFFSNPAVNGDTVAGMASANYQFYVGNIGHAGFAYAHDFSGIGTLQMGIQHLNYGSIQGYDASGVETGKFNAQETALVVGKSHQIGNYRLGVNLKGAFSNLAGYRATALAADVGGMFVHPNRNFTVGLVMKNFGWVLSDYAVKTSTMPFDVQVGSTIKPEHMPLRFSLTAHHLIKTNILAQQFSPAKISAFQKGLAHINFGVEVLLHRSVNILVGYNYFNHQALKLDNGGGGAGLSLGFSATVKNVDFVFSRTAYFAGKAVYAFTLSTSLNKLLKRQ